MLRSMSASFQLPHPNEGYDRLIHLKETDCPKIYTEAILENILERLRTSPAPGSLPPSFQNAGFRPSDRPWRGRGQGQENVSSDRGQTWTRGSAQPRNSDSSTPRRQWGQFQAPRNSDSRISADKPKPPPPGSSQIGGLISNDWRGSGSVDDPMTIE